MFRTISDETHTHQAQAAWQTWRHIADPERTANEPYDAQTPLVQQADPRLQPLLGGCCCYCNRELYHDGRQFGRPLRRLARPSRDLPTALVKVRRAILGTALTVSVLGTSVFTMLAAGTDRHLVRYYWQNVLIYQQEKRLEATETYTLLSSEEIHSDRPGS